MRIVSSLLLVLSGMLAGIAMVVSCSDDAPAKLDASDAPPADAAACDCPAAEPPLAGRFVIVANTRTIPANDDGGQNVACPAGTQLITGSCGTDDETTVVDLRLQQSRFYGSAAGWDCKVFNNTPAAVTIRAQAICLRLAP